MLSLLSLAGGSTVLAAVGIAALLIVGWPATAAVGTFRGTSPLSSPDPTPPTPPIRLIFIHHSTGENWLADNNGGLGIALMNNNYSAATATSTRTATVAPTSTGPVEPATATPTRTPTATVPAGQQTLVFQNGVSPNPAYAGTNDTILANDFANLNLGGAENLETFYGEAEYRRSLLRWDLSALPAGAMVNAATVELYRYDGDAPNAMLVALYRVTRAWIEGTGSDFYPGAGYTPDGATWTLAGPGLPWTTPAAISTPPSWLKSPSRPG